MKVSMGQMHAGDTYRVNFVIQTEAGEPQDLEGCTLTWQLVRPDGSTALTKTVSNGITVTNEALGQILLTISKGDIPVSGLYNYELECILPSGESYTQAHGALNVLSAIRATT